MEWVIVSVVAGTIALGTLALFRSLRRWRQPPPGRDAASQQADMYLRSETHLTDRW